MPHSEVVGKGVGGSWKAKSVGTTLPVSSLHASSFLAHVGNAVDITECFSRKYFVDTATDLMQESQLVADAKSYSGNTRCSFL